MILNWHGVRIDLNSVAAITGSSPLGLTVRNLTTNAKAFGLIARAVKLGLHRLRDLQLPAVLHWDMNHFVVLEAVKNDTLVILDPAVGRMTVRMEDASRHFTGIAIEFDPNEEFHREDLSRRFRMRDLINSIRGAKPMMALLFVIFFVLNLIGFFVPQVFQFAIDTATQQRSTELIPVLFGILFLIGLVTILIGVMARIVMANFSARVTFGMFQRIFLRLVFLPSSYFMRRSVGDTISRVQSFNQIEGLITSESVSTLINAAFGLAAVVLIFFYSPILGILCIVLALADVVIYLAFRRPITVATNKVVVLHAQAETTMIEAVRAFQSIKTLGIEEQQHSVVSSRMADATSAGLELERLQILQSIPTDIVGQLRSVIIPAVALYLVASGSMTIGMLYALLAYADKFSGGVSAVMAFLFGSLQARVHLDRLADIAFEPTEQPLPVLYGSDLSDAESSAEPGVPSASFPAIRSLALSGASFRYADSLPEILDSVSLSVAAGERVCLIGPSGAGKSTLMRLLAGLEMPTTGRFLVNDTVLARQDLSAFRRRISVVMQNDVLFSGSILDNVAKGAEPDTERVKEVLAAAQILLDIEMLPMGINTLIGDMGSVLSAGQRQRILIARSLYRRPDFLFLDEGTANLDDENKHAVFRQLCDTGMGLVYSTHDLDLTRYATTVYHLEAGVLSLRNDLIRRRRRARPVQD